MQSSGIKDGCSDRRHSASCSCSAMGRVSLDVNAAALISVERYAAPESFDGRDPGASGRFHKSESQ